MPSKCFASWASPNWTRPPRRRDKNRSCSDQPQNLPPYLLGVTGHNVKHALAGGGATGKQMNEAAASLVRIMEGYESYWRGESLSLSIFHPDIPREHHPPVPHACELPSRQRPRRPPHPSLRQLRTRFPPRATPLHSP